VIITPFRAFPGDAWGDTITWGNAGRPLTVDEAKNAFEAGSTVPYRSARTGEPRGIYKDAGGYEPRSVESQSSAPSRV